MLQALESAAMRKFGGFKLLVAYSSQTWLGTLFDGYRNSAHFRDKAH